MVRTSLRPELTSHLEQYSGTHRTFVNQALHFVGMPLIATGALGLLTHVSIGTATVRPMLHPNLAWLILIIFAVLYLRWDPRMAIAPMAGLLACGFIGSELNEWLATALLISGAILHVVGHALFEHKAPAFLSHSIAIVEGPAWYCAMLLGWRSRKR